MFLSCLARDVCRRGLMKHVLSGTAFQQLQAVIYSDFCGNIWLPVVVRGENLLCKTLPGFLLIPLSHVCLYLHNHQKAGLCCVLCTSYQNGALNSGARQLVPLVCAGPSLTWGTSWSKPCFCTGSAWNRLSQTKNWTWIPSVFHLMKDSELLTAVNRCLFRNRIWMMHKNFG